MAHLERLDSYIDFLKSGGPLPTFTGSTSSTSSVGKSFDEFLSKQFTNLQDIRSRSTDRVPFAPLSFVNGTTASSGATTSRGVPQVQGPSTAGIIGSGLLGLGGAALQSGALDPALEQLRQALGIESSFPGTVEGVAGAGGQFGSGLSPSSSGFNNASPIDPEFSGPGSTNGSTLGTLSQIGAVAGIGSALARGKPGQALAPSIGLLGASIPGFGVVGVIGGLLGAAFGFGEDFPLGEVIAFNKPSSETLPSGAKNNVPSFPEIKSGDLDTVFRTLKEQGIEVVSETIRFRDVSSDDPRAKPLQLPSIQVVIPGTEDTDFNDTTGFITLVPVVDDFTVRNRQQLFPGGVIPDKFFRWVPGNASNIGDEGAFDLRLSKLTDTADFRFEDVSINRFGDIESKNLFAERPGAKPVSQILGI